MATRSCRRGPATAWCGTGALSRAIASRRSTFFQLEKSECVAPANLVPVILADGRGIEPLRGVVDIFERPIRRKHDAIGAHHHHRAQECGCAEVAGRGDMEIVLKVVADPL